MKALLASRPPVICPRSVLRAVLSLASEEVAFFSETPAEELVEFAERDLGLTATEDVIEDIYFDTAERDLYRESSSGRLRTYPPHSLERDFDIVWVRWREPESLASLSATQLIRRHDVTVHQCDGRRGAIAKVLDRLTRNGLERVLTIRKTRYAFEVQPANVVVIGDSHQHGSADRYFGSKSVDCGLKLLIDACSKPSFQTIVEIEFGPAHRDQALYMALALERRFAGTLFPKKHNKIVYSLSPLPLPRLPALKPGAFPKQRFTPKEGPLSSRLRAGARSLVWQPAMSAPREWTPGFGFRLRPTWFVRRKPMKQSVTVCIPARLHFAVWNNVKGEEDLPGGGGVGVSTSAVETVIEVSHSKEGGAIDYPATTHLTKLFAMLVGHDARRLRVRIVRSHTLIHAGLGSNICLNTGLMWALNVLFGKPFSREVLSQIISWNYVENASHGRVCAGDDTGVGVASLLYGDVVWLSQSGRFEANMSASKLYAITALGPRSKPTLRHDSRLLRPNSLSQFSLELKYFDFVRAFARKTLWPIFARGDTDEFFLRFRKMRDRWLNTVAPGFCNPEVLTRWVAFTESQGALYSGMSSEGPLFFSLLRSKSDAVRLMNLVPGVFGNECTELRVARIGQRIQVRNSSA